MATDTEQQAEIEQLRAYIANLEAWQSKGERILNDRGVGAVFRLGEWWAERPWRKAPSSLTRLVQQIL